ncbi:MAG: hypothetical protein SFX18_17860 [Pirellulales bacterium]|nr:hypothetical protein [Pirellulales bacterium]
MKNFTLRGGLGVLLACTLACQGYLWAQKESDSPKSKAESGKAKSAESSKSKSKAAPEKAAPEKSADKPKTVKPRLPQYYSKLGIDEKQREAIYKLQADYQEEISKLEEQLKALKEKRDGEILEVLTAAQQKKLEELKQEAKDKSKEKAAEEKTTEKTEEKASDA